MFLQPGVRGIPDAHQQPASRVLSMELFEPLPGSKISRLGDLLRVLISADEQGSEIVRSIQVRQEELLKPRLFQFHLQQARQGIGDFIPLLSRNESSVQEIPETRGVEFFCTLIEGRLRHSTS
jgi:hypothetical protein